MDFVVDLNKYPESMKGMIGHITSLVDGRRTVRHGSHAVHKVLVKCDDHKVTLVLQESDLYMLGFINSHGTFRFSDHPGGEGSTLLPIGSSYTKPLCISILRGGDVQYRVLKRADIISAIITLSGYTAGTDVKELMKISLGIMAYMISEALRFKNMFQKMSFVLKSGGGFTFAEFAEYVKNWQSISNGQIGGQIALSTYQR